MTRLTDEQIDDIAGAVDAVTVLASSWERDRSFARAIEAELSKQEPVAECSKLTEAAIDEYLADYTTEFDNYSHTPSDDERFVIKDAIMGLLAITPPLPAAPDTVQVPPEILKRAKSLRLNNGGPLAWHNSVLDWVIAAAPKGAS